MAREAPVAVATPASCRMPVHLALALVWAVWVCVPGGVAQMRMPPLLVTIYYNHDTSGGTSGCTGPVGSIDIHAIETPPSLQVSAIHLAARHRFQTVSTPGPMHCDIRTIPPSCGVLVLLSEQ